MLDESPMRSNGIMNRLKAMSNIISITGRWKFQLPPCASSSRSVQAVAIFVTLAVQFSVFTATGHGSNLAHSKNCHFPAIFNFGDSNSDTGSMSAAFHRVSYPNGFSFFGNPSGRYCDGRLVIDFIAEKLGLPYLSAYLDSIGTNFQHGANFAASGSTIQSLNGRMFEEGYSPISLDTQLLQFQQFKDRTFELYNQGRSSYATNNLPKPEDFSKALYTIDIGQNDLDAEFNSKTEEQVLASLHNLTSLFAQAVEKLYQLGARTFWIHNTGPFGCLPYVVIYHPPKPDNMDQNGCVKSQNEIAQVFNKQLKDRVSLLGKQHPDAVFTYTDIYTAKYSLISEAEKQGFVNPLEHCCGHFGDYRVECGKKAMVNGTEVSGDPCSNPEQHISWDGGHYSQAANKRIANRILDGSLSDPPTPIKEACHKHIRL